MQSQVITVSQLNRYVKSYFSENNLLNNLFVKGEITSSFYQSQSGHYYFTISEGGSRIKCIMFKSYVNQIKLPKEGTMVIVRGSVSLYEIDGTYQILVYDIQELGKGLSLIEYSRLREKLQKEGLFDPSRKKQIPQFPKGIGIITSGEGAAVTDIITGLDRWNNTIPIYIYPSLVQGDQAVSALICAVDKCIKEGFCDVLIIARGGGASETLAIFNDEKLIRYLSTIKIPFISAVGHEIDYTLIDELADKRASTPTAAAQLACVSKEEIINHIHFCIQSIKDITEKHLNEYELKLQNLLLLITSQSPRKKTEQLMQKVDYLKKILDSEVNHQIWLREVKLNALLDQLQILNPFRPFDKGFSILMDKKIYGKHISSINELKQGNIIFTQLMDGIVESKIIQIHGGNDNE